MQNFDFEQHIISQMCQDEATIESRIETEKVKLKYIKQYNNFLKNQLDAERLALKKRELDAQSRAFSTEVEDLKVLESA